MCISGPNINKANAIYFPIIYFTAYGIFSIINIKIKGIISTILIINFGLFSFYYFKIYNHFDNVFFESEIYKIININYEQIKDKNILIYSKNIEDYIYEKLGKIIKINNKEEIISIKEKKQFDLNAICIVDEENYKDYKKYYKKEKIYGNYYMLYN